MIPCRHSFLWSVPSGAAMIARHQAGAGVTQELRILMFSDEELTQALVLYLRRQGSSTAQGRLSVLSKKGYPAVEVQYAVGFGAEAERQAIGGEALAGALVLYCIEKGIPIRREM